MNSKDQILKSAFGLFVNKSYKAVTMSDLEKATGLTKGAFYHNFKNKKEIFIKVIDKYFFSSGFPESLVFEQNGSLSDFIKFFLLQLKRSMKQNLKLNGAIFDPIYLSLLIEARINYPLFNLKSEDFIANQSVRWINIIDKCKLSGEIKSELDSFIMAQNFMSIGTGIILFSKKHRSLEYILGVIKLQFNQMYNLMKN